MVQTLESNIVSATATTVNTKDFARELEWVSRFVEPKATIPILQNVLIRVSSAGAMQLTGTDLELAGHSSLETAGAGDAFASRASSAPASSRRACACACRLSRLRASAGRSGGL